MWRIGEGPGRSIGQLHAAIRCRTYNRKGQYLAAVGRCAVERSRDGCASWGGNIATFNYRQQVIGYLSIDRRTAHQWFSGTGCDVVHNKLWRTRGLYRNGGCPGILAIIARRQAG